MLRRRRLSTRRGNEFPRISNLAARYSATDSPITAATNGTGARPTDAGLVGRVNDLSGNGFYLTSSADGARVTWYQNGWGLGRSSFHSKVAGEDLYNNTTLASSVFAGTNPSWTVSLLVARYLCTGGSTAYYWGVLKNGGTIGVGATNPAFTLQGTNSAFVSLRPVLISGYAHDANTSLQSGQAFWDGANAVGCGSSAFNCYTIVKSGQSSKVYQNGFLVSTVTQASGTWTFASGDYVTFNKLFNGTTRTGLLDGHLFEACVFGKALTDSERQRVERYYLESIGFKYSTQVVTTPKQYHWFGHSMFTGSHATFCPPNYQLVLGNRIPYEERLIHCNRGVSGLRLIRTGADNDVVDAWNRSAETATNVKNGDFVVFREATNQIANSDDTNNGTMTTAVDAALPSLTTVIEAALTETDRVIYITDPPLATGNAVRNFGLNYWREQARTILGRYDRAIFVDSYALLDSGVFTLNPLYDSGDNVHLNNAGYKIEADLLATAASHLRSINPTSISSLKRWWHGRQGSRFAADAAIGDTGATLLDASSTVDHATQSTAGSRPTWKLGTATSNYKGFARFDGVDDLLSFTATNMSAWTIFFAVASSVADARLLGDTAGGASFVRLNDDVSTRVRCGSGATVRFDHATRSDFDIVAVTSDVRLWLNGVEGTADSTFTGNLTVDGFGTTANLFSGDMGDLMIFNAALDSTTLNQVGNYLAFIYGKTWTNI